MTEEINMTISEFKSSNEKSLTYLTSELRKIRTGKATPDMLDGVLVDYYGSMTALSQVANIGTLDGRTLTVQPWEKSILGDRKSTRLNSSHVRTSYAVFCLKKKQIQDCSMSRLQ